MKKLLIIIGVVFVNLIFVITSIYIYLYKIKLEQLTEETNVEIWVFLITLFLFVITIGMINKKILFQFSFGIYLILISTFNYFIYWINYNYSSKGEFVTLKIRDAIWDDDGFFLNPAFNDTKSIVKVEQNVCFKVDSIDFRIDKGLFGFKILTNNAVLIPSKNCDNSLCEDSTSKNYETYFNNGQELTKIRCYYQAICEFNKAIKLNKTESKTYYYRGTSFLALQNYKSALIDFYIALEIEKAKNSKTEIEQAFKENTDKLVSSIITDIESNNIRKIETLNIEDKLNKIQLANKFDNYTTRLNYCIKKLKKN